MKVNIFIQVSRKLQLASLSFFILSFYHFKESMRNLSIFILFLIYISSKIITIWIQTIWSGIFSSFLGIPRGPHLLDVEEQDCKALTYKASNETVKAQMVTDFNELA